MKLTQLPLLSKAECNLICETFEEHKDRFKMSSDNGETYISAYESKLKRDFPDVHEFLEERIEERVVGVITSIMNPVRVIKSFACRYTTDTSTHMPHHYDANDFTVLIYLNDDFEGGGTSFPFIKKTIGVKDTGVGGSVTFPGLNIKSWHGAEPITKGTRYTISVRLVRENIFYKIFNTFRFIGLMCLTSILNKFPNLYKTK